ncbi:BA75_04520T0 [Komagataella pastoris]|uniref:BA75_04520T0 n=1 Tax=Komagataella pastoris TaxID=4922 RepID=A0A1B2JJ02_PICPA|nr:BA75_04520T0 [Komagataella pastoris]
MFSFAYLKVRFHLTKSPRFKHIFRCLVGPFIVSLAMEETLAQLVCNLDQFRLQRIRNETKFKQLNSNDKNVLNLIQTNNSDLSVQKYNGLSCIMSELGNNGQNIIKLKLDHLDNIFDLKSLGEEVDSLRLRYKRVLRQHFPEVSEAECFDDANIKSLEPTKDLGSESDIKYLLSGRLTQDQVGLQIRLEDQMGDKEANLKRENFKQIELYVINQVEKLLTTLDQCRDPDKIKMNRLKNSVIETSSMFLEYVQSHIDGAKYYPSFYNNLAQLSRIKTRISLEYGELKKCVLTETQLQQHESQSWGILIRCLQITLKDTDLEQRGSEIRLTVSQARVLGQAYAQMAHILLERASRVMKQQSTTSFPYLDSILTLASYLLYLSGNFGNIVSKVVSINVNPYAKLCQGVFKESLLREMTDVYINSCESKEKSSSTCLLDDR